MSAWKCTEAGCRKTGQAADDDRAQRALTFHLRVDHKAPVVARVAPIVPAVEKRPGKRKARPAADKVISMAGQDYLDIAGIAERLRVKPSSVQVYHTRATRNRRDGAPKDWDLPEPDATFGRTPVWLVSTVEAWEKRRPGVSTEAATEARRKGKV